jgi:hypothetical protein
LIVAESLAIRQSKAIPDAILSSGPTKWQRIGNQIDAALAPATRYTTATSTPLWEESRLATAVQHHAFYIPARSFLPCVFV